MGDIFAVNLARGGNGSVLELWVVGRQSREEKVFGSRRISLGQTDESCRAQWDIVRKSGQLQVDCGCALGFASCDQAVGGGHQSIGGTGRVLVKGSPQLI